jgi:hypothetical protein
VIIFRLTQSFLLYLILFIFRAAAVLLGFFVVPIAYLFRDGDHFPKWAWIWDNREDGIFGADWFERYTGLKKGFRRCYWWSAIRNPANNMRFIDLFNVEHRDGLTYKIYGNRETPDPRTARQMGGKVWHLTLVRQSGIWYFSFWLIKAFKNNRHFRIRLGWKCTPEWIERPREGIYKYSGMTFQFLPWRKG